MLVGAFNQAFSVIVKTDGLFAALIYTPEEGVLGAPPVLQVEGLQKVCGQQLELLVCDISVAAAVAAGVDLQHISQKRPNRGHVRERVGVVNQQKQNCVVAR